MIKYLLLRKIKNRFVRTGEMFLIEKNFKAINREECNLSSIEYKWINSEHINEIASLKNLSYAIIEGYYNQKSRCLAAYKNDDLIGYVWCHFKTYRWPFFDYSIDCSLKPYIGPDFVRVEFRGKHVHGALLSFMFNELYSHGYKNALGSVWTNNVSSIKGLVRVGFSPIRSIFAIRVINFLIYKKIKELKQWPKIKGL